MEYRVTNLGLVALTVAHADMLKQYICLYQRASAELEVEKITPWKQATTKWLMNHTHMSTLHQFLWNCYFLSHTTPSSSPANWASHQELSYTSSPRGISRAFFSSLQYRTHLDQTTWWSRTKREAPPPRFLVLQNPSDLLPQWIIVQHFAVFCHQHFETSRFHCLPPR